MSDCGGPPARCVGVYANVFFDYENGDQEVAGAGGDARATKKQRLKLTHHDFVTPRCGELYRPIQPPSTVRISPCT